MAHVSDPKVEGATEEACNRLGLPFPLTIEHVLESLDLGRHFGTQFDAANTALFNYHLRAKTGLGLTPKQVARGPREWHSAVDAVGHFARDRGVRPDDGTLRQVIFFAGRLAAAAPASSDGRRWIKREVMQLLGLAGRLGIQPSVATLSRAVEVLLGLRANREAANRLLEFVGGLPEGGQLDPRDQARLQATGQAVVRRLLQFNEPSKAIEVLQRMRDRQDLFGSLAASPAAAGSALTMALEQADPEVSLQCLRLIEQIRVEPAGKSEALPERPIKMDEGTLLACLNVAGATGHVALADEAWAAMLRSRAMPYEDKGRGRRGGGGSPMPAAYHAAIATHARAGSLERAFALLEELHANVARVEQRRRGPNHQHQVAPAAGDTSPPDAVAGGAADAAASDAGGRAGPRRALQHRFIQPLVDALAEQGADSVDAGYYLLEGLHEQGKQPVTAASLDVIIAACGRIGDLNRAFLTYEAFPKLGLKAGTSTYNALIEACLSNGHVRSVFKVVEEMQQQDPPASPDEGTHSAVIRTYLALNDPARALEALGDMVRLQCEPSTALLEDMIVKFARLGADKAVERVRDELVRRRFDFSGLHARAQAWAGEDDRLGQLREDRLLVGVEGYVRLKEVPEVGEDAEQQLRAQAASRQHEDHPHDEAEDRTRSQEHV